MTETTTPQRTLRFGEPLPLVRTRANRNPMFAFGALGGRFVLACVIQDFSAPAAQTALAAIPTAPSDEGASLCAIFTGEESNATLAALSANRLIFTDRAVAAQSGLYDPKLPAGRWILFDQNLRVVSVWPLERAADALKALSIARPVVADSFAPVLVAPNVFEPDFCTGLINYYRQQGGEASGVTQQDQTGRTFVTLDDAFKRRSDCVIEDATVRQAIMQRIHWRLAPMIERSFMWRPTRMERYLVARYDAESGGFFKPHRDNTTNGTAHRRFAVTINLNADEYDGGDLRFPEFGARTYRAPTGGAVVFACALLHEATPVTRGERFAFLPFLYDDEAAKVREANNKYLDESIGTYADKG